MEKTRFVSLSGNEKKQGCLVIVVLVAWAVWIGLMSAADLYMNWQIEQSLFIASDSFVDFRWINHLTFSLLLFVPLLIAYFVTKTPRLKIAVQVWMLGAIFALVSVPTKFFWITSQQLTAAVQALILLFYAGILFFIRQKDDKPVKAKKKSNSIAGVAIFMTAIMTLPWVLWGALGSFYDTIIYLLLGVAFAYFTVVVIYPYLFERTQPDDRELQVSDFLLDGFVVALFFIIVLTGLAQNGSQLMQVITLPISGWVIAFFAMISRENKDRGKIFAGLIAAVALVMPVLWFDTDELSLVISTSEGSTMSWALRAAWSTFSVALMIFVINIVNLKSLAKLRFSRKGNLILIGIAVAGLAFCYLGFGQPGFYGEKIFVVMSQQADLTETTKIQNVEERRAGVYETMVRTAEDSQTDLRAQLDAWHLEYTPYYLVNGLEVKAGPIITARIQERSDVARVLESPQLRPLPKAEQTTNSSPTGKPNEEPWNLTMIGVDKVHSTLSITGSGIVIGQTDTGVDGNHEQLSKSYRGYSGSDDYNWLDPWNGTPYPTDAEGHGTASLGIVVGTDIGIAPDAEWIGCVNLGRNLGNSAKYLDCMQFMLAPYPQGGNAFKDGDPTKGAMIINNSWGCPRVEGCDAETLETAADALEKAGIFLSVAAGNTGYYGCSTVTDPLAIYTDVFTVGSVDRDGQLSSFSSLGPVLVDGSGRVKPDLLAPGEDIVLAFPDNQYMTASGTSFAAPHVTGVVALMWSANPSLIGDIETTREILEVTATKYSGTYPACVTDSSTPNDAAGYGIVDAYAAVEKAISLK